MLFDPGSTHLYVSVALSCHANVEPIRMSYGVLISTPMGQEVVVNKVFGDCPLVIQGVEFLADLIEMPFQDYDVIIGMDWLHRHHAVVDCKLKQVTFKTLECAHVMIQVQKYSMPSNVISVAKASWMMRSGCTAYLAHVVDT